MDVTTSYHLVHRALTIIGTANYTDAVSTANRRTYYLPGQTPARPTACLSNVSGLPGTDHRHTE